MFWCSFRERALAASLKQSLWQRIEGEWVPFRERALAASLKLEDCGGGRRDGEIFPRASARGLIEAIASSSTVNKRSSAFRERALAASLKPGGPCSEADPQEFLSASERSRPH